MRANRYEQSGIVGLYSTIEGEVWMLGECQQQGSGMANFCEILIINESQKLNLIESEKIYLFNRVPRIDNRRHLCGSPTHTLDTTVS